MSAAPRLDTVEGFAALSASLEDPFADRARLLAAAGLEEADFAELSEHWLARLGAGTEESDALVGRYAESYAKRRHLEISSIPVGSMEAVPAAVVEAVPAAAAGAVPAVVSNPVVSPARGEVPSFLKGGPIVESAPLPSAFPAPSMYAAPPEMRTPVDIARPEIQIRNETSDVDLSKVLSGLSGKMPFDPSRPSAAAVPSFAPSPRAPLSGETVDINVAELARRALSAGPPGRPPAAPPPVQTPPNTNAPSQAQAAPPGKRLIRFDPQTGKPLATPQWVDLPPGPDVPPGKAR